MDTFARRLTLLNYIRQSAEPVSTDDIARHLQSMGYMDDFEVARSAQRLIQRDLQALLGDLDEEGEASNPYGLQRRSGDRKTAFWSIDPYGIAQFDFESMPQNMALTLTLCEKHLGQILPHNTLYALQQFFDRAQLKLNQQHQAHSKDYVRLKDAVEFFQRGQSLQAPDVDLAILDTCYRCILQNKTLHFVYHRGEDAKEYEVNPLGVAFLLPKIYLIATKVGGDEGDYRSFLIHKIKEAWPGHSTLRRQTPFNLRDYLEDGNLDLLIDPSDQSRYQVVIDLIDPSPRLLEDLSESPINRSQELIQQDGMWQLVLEAKRTVQLRNWLLSLGDSAVVTTPKVLKQDMLDHLEATLSRYLN